MREGWEKHKTPLEQKNKMDHDLSLVVTAKGPPSKEKRKFTKLQD